MMNETIRIAGTVDDSIVDGEGLRFAIFTQGCAHACKGCHNPQTWSFKGGKVVSIQSLYEAIMDNPLLDGATFSGGDPFYQAKAMAVLAKALRKEGKSVWAYTGFTYEEIIKSDDADMMNLLNEVDVLVDGPFILEEKDISLHFRGSRNQRVIDMNATRESGEIVLLYDD